MDLPYIKAEEMNIEGMKAMAPAKERDMSTLPTETLLSTLTGHDTEFDSILREQYRKEKHKN